MAKNCLSLSKLRYFLGIRSRGAGKSGKSFLQLKLKQSNLCSKPQVLSMEPLLVAMLHVVFQTTCDGEDSINSKKSILRLYPTRPKAQERHHLPNSRGTRLLLYYVLTGRSVEKPK
jgi:hypothetical protein